MDWRQLIIDHPPLAMLAVLPIVGLGAFLKIGLVFATGTAEDEDPPE
jgi:hypothetical protein